MAPRRKRSTVKVAAQDLSRIERAAKRKEQKDQGVFDGRYRPRVVKNKKGYTRKRKHRAAGSEE